MEFDLLTLIILAVVGLIAGVIDAIAGGGGLLTLPALLTVGLDPTTALATNKGQGVFGSTAACVRFLRSPLLDHSRAWTGFWAGLVGAAFGALLLQCLPPQVLRPVIVVLLLIAAATVLIARPAPGAKRVRPLWLWFFTSLIIGSYDGFFGPGTGTFLILAGVLWWGRTYDSASADAKVVNAASNIGALIIFSYLGQVLWIPALAMAGGQLIGGWTGAHLVVHNGQRLVRTCAVVISLILAVKLTCDMFFT